LKIENEDEKGRYCSIYFIT